MCQLNNRFMKNTTITLDEKTLEDGRRYARQLGQSFNAWVNKLIRDAIKRSQESEMVELLEMSDRIAGDSGGRSWSKEEIYDR